MPKLVSDAPNIPPRLFGAAPLRFVPEPNSASKSIPAVNCSIIAIAPMISLNQRCGAGLKDKNRLALDSFEHFGAQHRSIRQVRLDAKDIRQPVFEVNPSN